MKRRQGKQPPQNLASKKGKGKLILPRNYLPQKLGQGTSWFVLDAESSLLCEPIGVLVETRLNIPPCIHLISNNHLWYSEIAENR